MTHLEQLKQTLIDTLELDASFASSDADTLLLGSLPEFDSMGVILVITALEEQFDIVVEDDDISGETFESLGALVSFIESKVGV